mgnify:CR=1 FL=1
MLPWLVRESVSVANLRGEFVRIVTSYVLDILTYVSYFIESRLVPTVGRVLTCGHIIALFDQ